MQSDTIEQPSGKIFYVGQTPVGIIECRRKRLVLMVADQWENEEELRRKLEGAIARLTKQRIPRTISRESAKDLEDN